MEKNCCDLIVWKLNSFGSGVAFLKLIFSFFVIEGGCRGGGGYLHFMFCVGDSDSCDMLATPKCSPFSYLLFFCPWKVVTGIKVLWSKTMSVVL